MSKPKLWLKGIDLPSTRTQTEPKPKIVSSSQYLT